MKLKKLKYDKYFKKPSLQIVPVGMQDSDNKNLTKSKNIQALIYKNKAEDGSSFEIDLYVITQPTKIPIPALLANEDLYQIFFGGDLRNVREFDAEADIWLGKENEKHTVNSTSIIHLTKELARDQIHFKKVNKPIIFKNVFFCLK